MAHLPSASTYMLTRPLCGGLGIDLVRKPPHDSTQDYSLLPAHGVISTVLPAMLVRGRVDEQYNFAG